MTPRLQLLVIISQIILSYGCMFFTTSNSPFLLSHCCGQIGLRAEFNHLAEEHSLEHYKLYIAHSKFTLHKYSFNTGRNFADPLNLPGILVFAKTLNNEYMHTYKPQME